MTLIHLHPPRPRLTLRVGITGHRPNKLDTTAAERIKRQLVHVYAAIDRAAAELLRANAGVYAEEGFWYDSIESLMRLIAAAPQDSRLRAQLASLLKQVGLDDVAQAQ